MICSGGPLGCRIRGHIEMNDLPATVKEDNEAVQNIENTGRTEFWRSTESISLDITLH
jgi:hypothetical protein